MRRLWELVDKKVKRTLTNDEVVIGMVESWDDPDSMLSGEQEITINYFSYADSEIKTIEIID